MHQQASLGEDVLSVLSLFFHALAGHVILTELLSLNGNCSLFTASCLPHYWWWIYLDFNV